MRTFDDGPLQPHRGSEGELRKLVLGRSASVLKFKRDTGGLRLQKHDSTDFMSLPIQQLVDNIKDTPSFTRRRGPCLLPLSSRPFRLSCPHFG